MDETLNDLHLKKGQLHTNKEILEGQLRHLNEVELKEVNAAINEHFKAANKKEEPAPTPEKTSKDKGKHKT